MAQDSPQNPGKDEKISNKTMDDLPHEIFSRILVGVDIVQRQRLRCVSKKWKGAIESPVVFSVVKFDFTFLRKLGRLGTSAFYGQLAKFLTNDTRIVIFMVDKGPNDDIPSWTKYEQLGYAGLRELMQFLTGVVKNGNVGTLVWRNMWVFFDYVLKITVSRKKEMMLVFYGVNLECVTLDDFQMNDLEIRELTCTITYHPNASEDDNKIALTEFLSKYMPELTDEDYILLQKTLNFDPSWSYAGYPAPFIQTWLFKNPSKTSLDFDVQTANSFVQHQLVRFARAVSFDGMDDEDDEEDESDDDDDVSVASSSEGSEEADGPEENSV